MKGLNKNSGFTLVELIVTLIILGIISTVAYVYWSRSTTILDAQTSIFVNVLRYTQNLSITRNEKCRLIINTSNDSFQIQDSNGNTLPIPPDTIASSRVLDPPVSFGTITGLTSSNNIIFDGKGTPYYKDASTSQIELLTVNATINLSEPSGVTRTVYITKTTGKISRDSP